MEAEPAGHFYSSPTAFSYRFEPPADLEMRLINIETFTLEEFLDYKVPPYAILSHTWGSDDEELTFRDVEEGNIDKPGVGSIKFKGSCRQAEKDGLGYVWIDTCCIDKTNLVELSEAINSMFRWYQRASVCYTYLSDVPGDDNPRSFTSKFRTSRWFRRGWTLQELLAPKQLRFYGSNWGCLGTKATTRTILEKITGIPCRILLGITSLHRASIAQRMSWAAGRDTKRKEDLAYCLLGVFGVAMPMIYGEGGDQAFFRLQEHIMRTTKDDSILAWGLSGGDSPDGSSDQIHQAGRILATTPSDFARSGHIVYREKTTSPSSLDISGGSLRLYLSLLTTPTGGTVGLLNCGPEKDLGQAVGIPLAQTAWWVSNEYFRPEGCHAALQPVAAFGASTTLIHIQNDNRSKLADANRQYWLYDDDEFAQVNLDLVDVSPLSCWDRDKAMIVSAITPSDATTHPILARFQHRDEESPDFIVLLGFERQGTPTEPRCCVMVCSGEISLQELAEKTQYLVPKASRKSSASNGLLHLRITLEPDTQPSIFTMKPEALPCPPDSSINIGTELFKTNLMLELVEIWEAREEHHAGTKALKQEVENRCHWLQQVREEREMVEDELKKLEERRNMLAEKESNGAEEVRLLSQRQAEVGKQYERVSRRWSHARKRWNELVHIDSDEHGYESERAADWMPLRWAAENGYVEMVKLLLSKGADLAVADKDGWAPLTAAANRGHLDVVRLLVEKGVDVNSKDQEARTALWYACEGEHEAVVQLLRRSGAITSNVNATWRLWQTLEGHSNCVHTVAFSPDLAMLASASVDKTVRLWDAATGQLRQTLEGHDSTVLSVAFSHDSTLLASSSDDRTARLWDVATGRLRQTLEGHSHYVRWVTFSPDSTVLASASADKTIRLWDVATGRLRQTLEGHSHYVVSVAFSPDSTLLASASDDRTVRLWDVATGRLRQTLEGHGNWVVRAVFSPNSKTVASASGDGAVRLWDAATGRLRQKLTGHSSYVYSVAFSPDSTLVASASEDKTIRLWDAATGRLRQILEGHNGAVRSVTFSPDSAVIASASADKTIRLWDMVRGNLRFLVRKGISAPNDG